MPKKLELPSNFRVVVYPAEPWFLREGAEYARQMESICQDLKLSIRRHVDNCGQIHIESDQDYVCEYCGYKWGGKDDDYNGGCCDKDEENNPEFLNEKQTV